VLQFIHCTSLLLGSRHSSLDPLKRSERLPVARVKSLIITVLTDADMRQEEFRVPVPGGAGLPEAGKAKLKDIVAALSAPIAAMSASSMYISATEQKRWIQGRFGFGAIA
jgi:2-oxoglutarate dehydrogenase complex dehydrogenase (E1) component-like enzyme